MSLIEVYEKLLAPFGVFVIHQDRSEYGVQSSHIKGVTRYGAHVDILVVDPTGKRSVRDMLDEATKRSIALVTAA